MSNIVRYRFRDPSQELAGHVYLRGSVATTGFAVICQGMPFVPCMEAIVPPIVDAGLAAIQLQYAGTFDSGGRFTPNEAIDSVGRLVKLLASDKGLVDIRDETPMKIPSHRCVVVGHSFGSWIALQSCARFDGVSAGVMIAPYFGFTKKHGVVGAETLIDHLNYVRRAVPLTHRFEDNSAWDSLYSGNEVTRHRELRCPLYPVLGQRDGNLSRSVLEEWIAEQNDPNLRPLTEIEGAGHGMEEVAKSEAFLQIIRSLTK